MKQHLTKAYLYQRTSLNLPPCWKSQFKKIVDEFTRKILWLHDASSNNNPLIITNKFSICIKMYKLKS